MARLLISNDDGITAPGLCALARELLKHNYDIRICAPEREQSAMSHAITVRKPLYVEKMEMPGDLSSVKAVKVSGTPADCVRIALNVSLFGDDDDDDWKPDLVLSGINRGHNSGLHVLYSGTVGAAMEAVVFGFPAMALSLNHPTTYPSPDDVWPFDIAAEESVAIIAEHLARLKSLEISKNIVMNVNFPNATSRKSIKGIKATKQGISRFSESFEEENMSKGPRRCFTLCGQMTILDKDDTYDTFAINNNWISVTPLSLLNMASSDKDNVSMDIFQKWSIFKPR